MKLFFLAITFILSSTAMADSISCVEHLKWVTTANPVQDAGKALAGNDIRLKAVWGRRSINKIPGTK